MYGIRDDIVFGQVERDRLVEAKTKDTADDKYDLIFGSGHRTQQEGFCLLCSNDPRNSWADRMTPFHYTREQYAEHQSNCLRQHLTACMTYWRLTLARKDLPRPSFGPLAPPIVDSTAAAPSSSYLRPSAARGDHEAPGSVADVVCDSSGEEADDVSFVGMARAMMLIHSTKGRFRRTTTSTANLHPP